MNKKNIFTVLLIVIIIFCIYIIYYQTSIINILNKTISQKNTEISKISENVLILEDNISSLSNTILLKNRELLDLNKEINIKEKEIEKLLPIEKDYHIIIVKYGDGIVTPVKVKIREGSGVLSVDVDGIHLDGDTLESIRKAEKIASKITGIDTSKKDISISLTNMISDRDPVLFIDGPSAGAAMTVVLAAALTNSTLDMNTAITGSINPDGTIGYVGLISKKAMAVKKAGIKKFFVPYGQEISVSGLDVIGVKNVEDVINNVIIDWKPE